MSNIRFHRARREEEQVRQSLDDYRRKIRFKQVKFSIVVLTWQVTIMILRFVNTITHDETYLANLLK